jgi:2-methylcitrate dehydratase PrpD
MAKISIIMVRRIILTHERRPGKGFTMASYTSTLAEFAGTTTLADIPATARAATRRLVLDTLGCAVGGRSVPSSQVVTRLKIRAGGPPEATVLVGGERLGLTGAIYVNSHYANALDAEETIRHSGHLAAATVPPALGVAQYAQASGADFLAAVTIGFDVAARVALSLRALDTDAQGRTVMSKVIGSSWAGFAATVASARLLGLNPDQLLDAFGLTVASAPLPIAGRWGVQAAPRPMTKYGLYGAIAEAGVMGTLLAREGLDGYRDILDGDYGFWRMNGSPSCDWDELTDGLGRRWLVEETSYKLFPACQWAMPALDLFFRMLAEHDLSPEDVDAVEALVPQAALTKHMADLDVQTVVDGQFSIPHLLSLAARGGPPAPRWHSDELRTDPRIREFAGRVRVGVFDRAGPILAELMRTQGHAHLIPTQLSIVARGQTHTAVSNTNAHDQWDFLAAQSDQALEEKFGRFAGAELSAPSVASAVATIARIEDEPNVERLVASLVAST